MMSIDEKEKRMQKACELMEQLKPIAERLTLHYTAQAKAVSPHLMDGPMYKREAAMIIAMIGMRTNGEDHIQYGSLIRRICDLLEPTMEPGE